MPGDVEQRCHLGKARPQLIGDMAPDLAGALAAGCTKTWRRAAETTVCWPLGTWQAASEGNEHDSVAKWRVAALPVAAEVHRGAVRGDQSDDGAELFAIAGATVTLAKGGFPRVAGEAGTTRCGDGGRSRRGGSG